MKTDAAPALTPETELELLVHRLDESRDTYLHVLEGITEKAALFRPASDRWSILECAEHVAVAERQMLAIWTKTSQAGESPRERDDLITTGILDRRRKDLAPERSRPTGRYGSLLEAAVEFTSNRRATIEHLREHHAELRSRTVQHPLAGTIDGHQLLLLMAGHAERHAAQIADIKDHPGYPGAGTKG